MGFRVVSTLITFVFLSLLLAGIVGARADESDASANARIQSLFNQLEIAGNAYNSGGSSATGAALLSSGCGAASGQLNQLVTSWLPSSRSSVEGASFADQAEAFFYNRGLSIAGSGAASAMSSGCNALMGGELGSGLNLENQLMLGLIGGGIGAANASGLPFLGRLEAETGTERGEWITSLTTIQPLWQDEAGLNHVFTQLAWRQVDGEDTVNTGLAYRRLNEEKTVLYGVNAFFDHAFAMNHNRMSVGADIQTSLLGAAFNRYIPLSDWKSRDALWEERAAGGYDLEVHGQLPELPSWTASVKGYQWDGSDHQNDDQSNQIDNTYGYVTTLEYSPVPALAIRGGVRDENAESPSAEFAMRLNLNFNDPLALQFKPRLELASVEDRVYQKVSRENTIRIQERRKASSLLTVIETTGANLADGQPGIVSLNVGQTLLVPTIVSVANTVGAVARLRLSDGGILTLGQNTQVRIEPGILTLINGTAQYVSGATNVAVNVPGGTITLLGTDIDLASNGTDTTVRVRDGSIRLDGTASGSVTISAGEMAESISGTVATVLAGMAAYTDHPDQVSRLIDRVASAQSGIKVAPYPVEAPRLVTTSTTPGQTIVIGLRFNTSVTSSGGPSRLTFTINGNTRTAGLSSGSGTNDLRFSYTLQASDAGASTTFTVTSFDSNGATITGDGKLAVTTIADTTLDLGAAIGNTATLAMDFINNTYSLLGTTYNSLTSFLTAAGGTFSRASTATYTDATGTLQTASADTPRFDYDPVTHAAKGLLIEESRTNRIVNSYFENWTGAYPNGWNNPGNNITKISGVFGQNAVRITGPYGNDGNRLSMPVTGPFTAGTNYTATIRVRLVSGTGSLGIAIDSWATNAFQFSTASMTPGSWVTLSATGSPPSTVGGSGGLHTNSTNIVVDIDWIQIEEGSFATSYIPTTTSSLTRQAEILTVPVGTWYNSSSGTLYSFGNLLHGFNSFVASLWEDGNDYISTRFNGAQYLMVRRNNAIQGDIGLGGSYIAGQSTKMVVAGDATGGAASLNGGTVVTNGIVSQPAVTNLQVGGFAGGAVSTTIIKRVEYYPARLPNATLQTLTAP